MVAGLAVPHVAAIIPRLRTGIAVQDTVATWGKSLAGTVSVRGALEALVSGLGADCGTVVRSLPGDPRPMKIALCDLTAPSPARQLARTFAQTCFGSLAFSAHPGSLWLGSEQADHATGDPSLADWQAARGFGEFVVLVLSSGVQGRDHVELHFRDPLSGDVRQVLADLMPDLTHPWHSREVALATRVRSTPRRNDPNRFRIGIDMSILDPENPQRLSRTEFRVCLLLSTGLPTDAISRELDLSLPTVRTHLRSVLAKTGCGSVAELAFRLTNGAGSDDTMSRSA